MDFSKFGLGALMQQAQKMKDDMREIQENLASRSVESRSASGKVTVVMSGKQQVLSVQVSDELATQKPALEREIQEAVNNALKASQELAAAEMGKIAAGLGPLASLLKSH